ncbi:hypothetical protein OQA88_10791 [Cercophora sp. LCS_1]
MLATTLSPIPGVSIQPQADGVDILKFRTTHSPSEQYATGFNDGLGDRDIIENSMRNQNLRHTNDFKDCWTFFMDGDEYGKSFKIVKEKEQTLAGFAPLIQAGYCIPQSTGELILQRQVYLLQGLVVIIDDILEEGSKTRKKKQAAKPSNNGPAQQLAIAVGNMTLEAPRKLSLPDVVAVAEDQKTALRERLDLLSAEPTVLTHDVNICFFSRPELVPDEKGRIMPVHTDKYISAAVFEAVHNSVRASAIWNYISHLLTILQSTNDKAYKSIVLQELSNICHLEYGRAQANFKRQVQAGLGPKWFKRVFNVYDKAGNARILHHMLRLCQPDTTAAKAVEWVKKLGDLHNSHPAERERFVEREFEAFGDLAVIVAFIHEMSPVIFMPSLSRKKGQMFVSRSADLDVELSELKKTIDLHEFAVPIGHLLEPGMAGGALKALDEFVIENAGSKLGFLYQDLIEESILDLEHQHELAKAKLAKIEAPATPVVIPEQPKERVKRRREKEKTRPSASSSFEFASHPGTKTAESVKEDVLPQTFKVGSDTAKTFSTLFAKSVSRGSTSWTTFTSAMGEIGFPVIPKFGSVFTFFPPKTMDVQKPLTLHRPHQPHIEGEKILVFARRLNRAYGWGERTFEVA